MGYTVFRSNEKETTRKGFGKVAHIPCIFDSRPGYHRLGSRYLIDRGLGAWLPANKRDVGITIPPGEQSLIDYANWLANFLEWAEVKGKDLLTISYLGDGVKAYEGDMLSGRWSRDGIPLSARTTNLRVDIACDFLSWLAEKGFRGDFVVPMQLKQTRFGVDPTGRSANTREVWVRQGKVRAPKRRLSMPTDEEVIAWLDRVYDKHGSAYGLMAETVVKTAVRRAEISCWRVDTLPDDVRQWKVEPRDSARAHQRVLVPIVYGAKGATYGKDHGDKVGPQRDIWVPLGLAERLVEYRMTMRTRSLRSWVNQAPTARERKKRIDDSVHLFLDAKTGERITAKQFYNAWTSVEGPFKGWSPHLGRDWWACDVLWNEMKRHEHLLAAGLNPPHALLESAALSIIRLVIQPQLGHVSSDTTMIYLQWIADRMGFDLSIRYERELGDD